MNEEESKLFEETISNGLLDEALRQVVYVLRTHLTTIQTTLNLVDDPRQSASVPALLTLARVSLIKTFELTDNAIERQLIPRVEKTSKQK